MWTQARADDERDWVVELLEDFMHLAPHRTPLRVIEAAQASQTLAAVVSLVRVDLLPEKARRVLIHHGYTSGGRGDK